MTDQNTATEIPMAESGLTISTGRDGTWLHFKSSTGRRASVNVENFYGERGHIIGAAMREWCEDRQRQAQAILEHEQP